MNATLFINFTLLAMIGIPIGHCINFYCTYYNRICMFTGTYVNMTFHIHCLIITIRRNECVRIQSEILQSYYTYKWFIDLKPMNHTHFFSIIRRKTNHFLMNNIYVCNNICMIKSILYFCDDSNDRDTASYWSLINTNNKQLLSCQTCLWKRDICCKRKNIIAVYVFLFPYNFMKKVKIKSVQLRCSK